MDPPTFSGKEIDFPEFERKWLAIVVPANLPQEAEIDRLREALPKEAKEMLTGISKTEKAWDILKKRYGDKDLIATMLKNELKGLSLTAKTDHEKIIILKIDKNDQRMDPRTLDFVVKLHFSFYPPSNRFHSRICHCNGFQTIIYNIH